MKISIITPVLQGEKTIRDTVESVVSQTSDTQLEYIVVDGGSEDGTLKIIEEYARDDLRFKIISGKDLNLNCTLPSTRWDSSCQ